jgi:hypothetical protein
MHTVRCAQSVARADPRSKPPRLYIGSDVDALRSFSGRYSGDAENGVKLASIVRLTVAQHTQYRLFGRPKVESQTVEQAATDGGDWYEDGPPADEEVGAMDQDDEDASAQAFRRYLGSLVREPDAEATAITVEDRAETLGELFETLKAGRSPVTADAFDKARGVGFMVCETVVAGASRHAEAAAAEEEARQAVAAAEAEAEAEAEAAAEAEAMAAAAATQTAEAAVRDAAEANEEDRAVSRWAESVRRQ